MIKNLSINDLVKKFSEHFDSYKNTSYNETQLRREFLDPLLKNLNWDVDNNSGYAETFKEVIHEDKIYIDGRSKSPDYSIQMGGKRLFFVEAKKPSVSIKDDIDPAFQIRRYGWNAKLPLCILTDFEEFAIYDTTIKPTAKEKSSKARIFYCNFREYLEPCKKYPEHKTNWEFICSLFSKDSVLRGSLEKFEKKGKKKGTDEVDDEFLKDIERWREGLAKNLALRNNLNQRDLNFATQATIDRIVFLRICEDREIEDYGKLLKITKSNNIYKALIKLFEDADDKYNSGLFHFNQKEKNRNGKADTLTTSLTVDDKTLKEIILSLYYPCPYEFSVMPADILGSVYERFLGKVIRLTSPHRIKIEEKPEVRKAGGVYYTPKYIVDYIVENTIGNILKGKEPNKIKNIKIIDPACGSGSFLIQAYQYLLNWHLNNYSKNKKKNKKLIYQTAKGNWRLTTQERKRILTSHIYGVDIDSQAVEVTKLSLLLKVLEGENRENIEKQLSLFKERALPDLESNIKCGNSLIGSDFYNQPNLELNEEETYKVNVFDWEKEFADIFKNGGFDVVIGNPPYGALWDKREIPYLEKYKSYEYQLNSFIFFIEKGIGLLKKQGRISYITPAVFLFQHYFQNIRKLMIDENALQKFLLLNYKVFKQPDIGDTCVFVLKKEFKKSNDVNYCLVEKESDFSNITYKSYKQSVIKNNERYEILLNTNVDLIKKIEANSNKLEHVANCIVGIKPYQKGKGKPKQTEDIVKSRIFDSSVKHGKEFKQYLIGKDIDRYSINPVKNRFIKYGEWLAEPRATAPFEKDKIILRQTSDIIRATFDDNKYYNLNNIYNIEIIDTTYSLKFLLGILNSNLMIYLYQFFVPEKGKLFAEVKKVNLNKLPIPKINFSNKTEKTKYDLLIKLVDKMLDLKKKEQKVKNPSEQTIIERQIQSTDKQIDELVYKLYKLTPDEIAIIEGNE